MTSNDLTLPFQKSAGLFELILVPLLGLILLMIIDTWCIRGAFALPFLLLLILGYLALRSPWWAVLTWALIYASVVLALLLYRAEETFTLPAVIPYLRTATFLAGGVVAAILAGYRARLEQSYNALFKVLADLPQPVIVSDISGTILLINREAGKLIDNPTNELSGLSFFSTFSSPDEQGQSIAKYLGYFNVENPGPFKITLQTRGGNQLALAASLSVVGTPAQRLAVTVVETIQERPAA
jgi:PAS domain-containing protein